MLDNLQQRFDFPQARPAHGPARHRTERRLTCAWAGENGQGHRNSARDEAEFGTPDDLPAGHPQTAFAEFVRDPSLQEKCTDLLDLVGKQVQRDLAVLVRRAFEYRSDQPRGELLQEAHTLGRRLPEAPQVLGLYMRPEQPLIIHQRLFDFIVSKQISGIGDAKLLGSLAFCLKEIAAAALRQDARRFPGDMLAHL